MAAAGRCMYPGCARAARPGYDFCSATHGRQFRQRSPGSAGSAPHAASARGQPVPYTSPPSGRSTTGSSNSDSGRLSSRTQLPQESRSPSQPWATSASGARRTAASAQSKLGAVAAASSSGNRAVPPPPPDFDLRTLPPGWHTARSDNGQLYFYDEDSYATRWTPPPAAAPPSSVARGAVAPAQGLSARQAPAPTPPAGALLFPELPRPGQPVLFYERGEPFYEFTNFAGGFPIVVGDAQWPTSEHYFQASKFAHKPRIQQLFLRDPSPRYAFELSRKFEADKRADWEAVKDRIMLGALRAKFTQNPELGELLMYTVPHELVESSPTDSYWGSGSDGRGRNMLGRLLETVRQELVASSTSQLPAPARSTPPQQQRLHRQRDSPTRTGL